MRIGEIRLLKVLLLTLIATLFFAWVASCASQATQAPAPAAQVTEAVVVEKEVENTVMVQPSGAEPTRPLWPTEAPAKKPTQLPIATPAPESPAMTPTEMAAEPTKIPPSSQPTPAGGFLPAATSMTTLPKPTPSPAVAPSIPAVEERFVELEWPSRMRLGDSDVARLSIIPSEEGYIVTTEFEEHQTITDTLRITRPAGYDLFAAARLDGVGFKIAPAYEEELFIQEGEPVSWRWTLTPSNPGQQRLSVMLKLRWKLADDPTGIVRETVAYSKGLDVQVISFLGLTQSQAMSTGWFGVLVGGALILVMFVTRPRRIETRHLSTPTSRAPNTSMVIELHPGVTILPFERALLQSLFQRYDRLILEKEFQSGYSSARAFLALPIHSDGRADAHTIAKIGERDSIQREFANYETFVNDTLPPMTARIQHAPVVVPRRARTVNAGAVPEIEHAAIQYTFIGEPGSAPVSLRNALLANPEPELIEKLYKCFGSNWWMQHRPYTFCLAYEYDRMLPTHLVIEPLDGHGKPLDGKTSPASLQLQVGEKVTLKNFTIAEQRADGKSLSLISQAIPGQPPLRIRWQSRLQPNGACGRVVATRQSILNGFVESFDLLGIPAPLAKIPALLAETVSGTQSIVHGDLNLENVLIGPGGFVWLIDFAQTREGHTLFDFAHLEAELIAHIMAHQFKNPADYLAWLPEMLRRISPGERMGIRSPKLTLDDSNLLRYQQLFDKLHELVRTCLLNPTQTREYRLALSIACLGALKFANLDLHSKHLLYLTGATLIKSL
jgi:hypothetical protein